MKLQSKKIPNEIKGLVNHILRKDGDCERIRNNYNKDPFGYTWYGHRLVCEPLFCSYGCIGYAIEYRGFYISIDNEMGKITWE